MKWRIKEKIEWIRFPLVFCWSLNMDMTNSEIKDNYYSIPIKGPHQKFFKFVLGKLYQFLFLLNGYTKWPRKFKTKMKILFSTL